MVYSPRDQLLVCVVLRIRAEEFRTLVCHICAKLLEARLRRRRKARSQRKRKQKTTSAYQPPLSVVSSEEDE
jgi:hypothetical protein